MRHSLRFLSATRAHLADYIDYLRQVDKELPSLHDIFPKSNAVEDVVKFHGSLCAAMEENAYPLIGFKVLPPEHEAITTLRGTQPVCFPIFSNLFQRKSVSVKQDRLQYIETAICLEVKHLEDCSTVDEASLNTGAFSPSLEVSGSRFPFYAPTLTAMACDLDGCVSITKGCDISMDSIKRETLKTTRFVLTHNQEPIQTGSAKLCMETPFTAVVTAAAYAKAIKAPTKKSLFVFCGGVSPRTPIQVGTYAFEWGRFGRLRYSVLP
ncbi:conserved hypothetical protein [Leishmania major strain Friedlin]|uniref:Uncharacterized protein n=1 Tax=Leishmania major TaxID=5664 RepID=Q4Q7N7_LEIMA|nr:conserved hypothetical protein [Leishmania major strain Friedlin]CAG9578234.1 hypothetical_protein_-_conserved [Leishmania major strain Friedlin]CAJ05996.1 conserved hypothetical protein [Leishmania major strain Friedlin]|eukprot:XP_001684661.1 conserved hypothetical protein [Leishmania major strain Friedlin]